MVLNLVVAHALDGIERVLLAVDDAGLECGVELAEGDRHSRGAERAELFDQDGWNPSRGSAGPKSLPGWSADYAR